MSVMNSFIDREVKSDLFILEALRIRLEGVLNFDMDRLPHHVSIRHPSKWIPFLCAHGGICVLGRYQSSNRHFETAKQLGCRSQSRLVHYSHRCVRSVPKNAWSGYGSPDFPANDGHRYCSIDAIVSAFYAVEAYSTSRSLLITLPPLNMKLGNPRKWLFTPEWSNLD